MKFCLFTACIMASGFSLFAQGGTVEELVSWMSGSFSSALQAERDSTYYAISLSMTPIWEKRFPGQHWLYVEQAVASKPDKPYRQRIYQIETQPDGSFSSTVYLLPHEEEAVGKGKEPGYFDRWEPEDLEIREGCTVFLRYSDREYSGGTSGRDCKSNLRGAQYATSYVSIRKDEIVSWDQGFDSSDVQVWGAVGGAYVFNRR